MARASHNYFYTKYKCAQDFSYSSVPEVRYKVF